MKMITFSFLPLNTGLVKINKTVSYDNHMSNPKQFTTWLYQDWN